MVERKVGAIALALGGICLIAMIVVGLLGGASKTDWIVMGSMWGILLLLLGAVHLDAWLFFKDLESED